MRRPGYCPTTIECAGISAPSTNEFAANTTSSPTRVSPRTLEREYRMTPVPNPDRLGGVIDALNRSAGRNP